MKFILLILICWTNYQLHQCVDDDYDLKLLLKENRKMRRDIGKFLTTRDKNVSAYPFIAMTNVNDQMLQYAKDHWKLDFLRSNNPDGVIIKEYEKMARLRQFYRDIKNEMRIKAGEQDVKFEHLDSHRMEQERNCKNNRDESLHKHNQGHLYLDQEFTHTRLSFKYTRPWRSYLRASKNLLKRTDKILRMAYDNGCKPTVSDSEDYHYFLTSCGKNFDSRLNRMKANETSKINKLIGRGSLSVASESVVTKHDPQLKNFEDSFKAIFEDYDRCLNLNVSLV